MKRTWIAAAALSALAACAEAPAPGPTEAAQETTLTTSAVVQTVDQTSRQVLLRADDGRMLSIVAGPEVRNLAQLAPGDRVTAVFIESVAARMATEGDLQQTVVTQASNRAPLGARPGAAAASVVTSVVRFDAFDPATGVVSFTGPTGVPHSMVAPAELRDFVAARKPGDLVAVEYSEAVAIGIEER
jgi:predicted thioesterase